MLNLKDSTIVIDAGHSLTSVGAVNGNVKENEQTILICNVLKFYLDQTFKTFFVDDSLSLEDSINVVNQNFPKLNDALALSIHINASGGKGAEIYYYADNPDSLDMSSLLINEYCKITGLRNRGAKPDTSVRFGRLGWIRDTYCWSLLIECCFIDNDEDLDYLLKYYNMIAYGIYCGICKVFDVTPVAIANQDNQIKADILMKINELTNLVNKL